MPVDAAVLEQLVGVALADAGAGDVTPPLTPGGSWTEERVAWLRAYHRRCRKGLSGPAGEATWAVVLGQSVVGSVRLKVTDQRDVLDTGIWLTRSARGRGVGTSAVSALLHEAVRLGATELRASTTPGNTGAHSLLRRIGFDVAASESGAGLEGSLDLHEERSRPKIVQGPLRRE